MVNHHDFRSLDKSIRKQKIIDKAAILFHKKGYSSTTLDDVSKELGITKAALYHYVESKEELLSIIYAQAIENIFRDTYEIAGMSLSPDEKLRRIIRHHIKNVIIKDLSMFSVFFSEESKLSEKGKLTPNYRPTASWGCAIGSTNGIGLKKDSMSLIELPIILLLCLRQVT
jgi:AcrR family transcriptional regulator